MSLASQVGLLATRIGTEFKTVRSTYVPNSLRGPIGGVTASTGVSGTVNLDPTLSNQRRLTLTGDTTIATIPAGADGQRILLEVNASGAQRTISFATSFEVSQAVPSRTFVINSGDWGYIAVICRGGTWRLVSAEPQSITSSAAVPSAWVPSDNGLLAWTELPSIPTLSVGAGDGGLIGSVLKCDTTDVSTGISFFITTAGSGFTANRSYVGLYNAAGALVAQTGDLAATINSVGMKTASWTSTVSVTPQQYYVGFIVTATTVPQWSATIGVIPSRGRTALAWRGSGQGTGYTALPSTRPTPTININSAWFGLV